MKKHIQLKPLLLVLGLATSLFSLGCSKQESTPATSKEAAQAAEEQSGDAKALAEAEAKKAAEMAKQAEEEAKKALQK